jgi:hypothetical protein
MDFATESSSRTAFEVIQSIAADDLQRTEVPSRTATKRSLQNSTASVDEVTRKVRIHSMASLLKQER